MSVKFSKPDDSIDLQKYSEGKSALTSYGKLTKTSV